MPRFKLDLSRGETVIIDPWLEGNPSYPRSHSVSRMDAMLLTHGHFDHINDAIPFIGRPKRLRELLQDQPETEVVALEPGESWTWD